MSNPISAIRPNFGMLTLKQGVNDMPSLKASFSPINNDVVDRGPIDGNIGAQLSAEELAKQFG